MFWITSIIYLHTLTFRELSTNNFFSYTANKRTSKETDGDEQVTPAPTCRGSNAARAREIK